MPGKTLLFTLELSLFASLVSAQCAPDCNRPDTDSCNYCAFLRLTHTCSQTPFGDCTGCCYATLPPSPPPTAPSPPDITLSHASLYRGELTALTVAGDALQDGDFWALVPCARTFPCDATAARCHLASSYYQMTQRYLFVCQTKQHVAEQDQTRFLSGAIERDMPPDRTAKYIA